MVYIILLVYLISLMITFGIRGINLFILIKDLAMELYEVDFDALEGDELIEHFNLKKVNYESFIPVLNVFKSLKGLYDYYKEYPDLCDDLETFGIIFPMANFEIYEYRKNPSIINLFKVLRNGRERRLKANYFEAIEKGEIVGQVYYEGDDNIDVIDTTIDFNDMLVSDIKKIIQTNDDNNHFSNFIHQHNGKITIARTLDNTRTIEEYTGLNYQDEIEKLREFRKMLLQDQKGKAFVKNMNSFKKY